MIVIRVQNFRFATHCNNEFGRGGGIFYTSTKIGLKHYYYFYGISCQFSPYIFGMVQLGYIMQHLVYIGIQCLLYFQPAFKNENNFIQTHNKS